MSAKTADPKGIYCKQALAVSTLPILQPHHFQTLSTIVILII